MWSEHSPSNQADGPDYLQLLGPNQWMPGDVLPGQQELALDWFERLGALFNDVLSLFAVGLGLPPEQFAAAFGNDATSLTKLISYPPTPDGAAGVNAHTDTPLDRGRATNVGWFHGDQGADRTRPRSEAPDIGSTTHTETYRDQLWNWFPRSSPEIMARHHGR